MATELEETDRAIREGFDDLQDRLDNPDSGCALARTLESDQAAAPAGGRPRRP